MMIQLSVSDDIIFYSGVLLIAIIVLTIAMFIKNKKITKFFEDLLDLIENGLKGA